MAPEISERTALDVVLRHTRSEVTNDVPHIMSTVSHWDVHYSLLSRSGTGLDLELATSREEATRYYEASRTGYNIVGSTHLKEISTSWYSLFDVVGKLEHIGMLGGVPATGRILDQPTTVLFPVWSDGIIGEIGWFPFDIGQIASDSVRQSSSDQSYLPRREMRNADVHAEFVKLWREGQTDAQCELLADECCAVIRTVALSEDSRTRVIARGKEEFRDYLAGPYVGDVRSIQVKNLVTGAYYVFAEYLLELEVGSTKVHRRLASLYPFDDASRIVAQLAYGFDFAAD